MKPMDHDLVAVRDLPPGIAEPSDEALARVRERVFARPAPRRLAWQLTMRRIWVPVAAAAAVLLVVGVGLYFLRPRTISQPQPHPLSSDPAEVRRVFDDLIAAAGNATPYRPRAGQLIYQESWMIDIDLADGRPYRERAETWIEPATTAYVASARGSLSPADPIPPAWASENAKDPHRSTPPGKRPFLELTSLVAGPTEPTAARRDFIDRITTYAGVSEDEQVWGAIYEMAVLDPLIPVERRVALYRVLGELPVSVGETGVDGRRLVIVRFAALIGAFAGGQGGGKSYDLLIDPATGRFAGTQVLSDAADPAWAPRAADGAVPEPSRSTGVLGGRSPMPPGTVDPALIRRDLYHFSLVENIGERG
uniref:hypothetical protein n=1 Tax=Paractinoplanes polyasparticus TaxID=2856853 RepID=UPI001C84BF43|nr:hypothetical protein [Actinoplanes polyasparticus]